mmetsp:Transcript_11164/g.35397  ORF Transcript_11164/g.35397 Transcript_11164/m.35397 type:complete len:315 (+) Transcript_11164:258-1202(+)
MMASSTSTPPISASCTSRRSAPQPSGLKVWLRRDAAMAWTTWTWHCTVVSRSNRLSARPASRWTSVSSSPRQQATAGGIVESFPLAKRVIMRSPSQRTRRLSCLMHSRAASTTTRSPRSASAESTDMDARRTWSLSLWSSRAAARTASASPIGACLARARITAMQTPSDGAVLLELLLRRSSTDRAVVTTVASPRPVSCARTASAADRAFELRCPSLSATKATADSSPRRQGSLKTSSASGASASSARRSTSSACRGSLAAAASAEEADLKDVSSCGPSAANTRRCESPLFSRCMAVPRAVPRPLCAHLPSWSC